MRRTDLPQLVKALRGPMTEFVRESHVRTALLINGAGQVLGQHGFTRSYEVMNVASLAAATHASAKALAEITKAPVEELIVIAIFDEESSLGIVQLFYHTLENQIAALPEFKVAYEATDQEDFERDLEAGLEINAPDQ